MKERFAFQPELDGLSADQLFHQAIETRTLRTGKEPSKPGDDEPFFMADLGQIRTTPMMGTNPFWYTNLLW